MFFVEFAIVLVCILLGARIGGIGLGVMGGMGLAILAFVFGVQPTSPPIDVMLMIMAVVSAAAAMQAAGGLDLMIKVATRILHKNPKYGTRLNVPPRANSSGLNAPISEPTAKSGTSTSR